MRRRCRGFVLGKVHESVAGGVAVAEVIKLDPLLTVVENEFVVEEQNRLLEFGFLEVFAPGWPLGSISPVFGPIHLQDPCTFGLGYNGGALVSKDDVAIGMIAMVVRIDDVTNRLIGGFLDGFNYVACFFGEIGVEDYDIILAHNPGVVAAAEHHFGIGGADGGIAEENTRCDLVHVVELHLRKVLGPGRVNGY
jgi:hypothetical protein